MSNDIKKRLLISKWRGVYEVVRDIEEAHNESLAEKDEKIATLEADLEEANKKIDGLEAEADAHADQLEEALVDLKYWFHDGIVHGKLVSDPRAMLRKIEDVL